MKYNRSVTETPSGKWHIVGSQIPVEYSGVYETKAEADKALVAVELQAKMQEMGVPKQFIDDKIIICV